MADGKYMSLLSDGLLSEFPRGTLCGLRDINVYES